MVPRFFIAKENMDPAKAIVTGKDAHHLIHVLRKKIGDKLEIIDSQANCYQAEITKIEDEKVTCKLIEKKKSKNELPVKVTLFQCLPKHKKMDFIIEKCTELGATQIIPVVSERSIPKLDADKAAKKVTRWNEIARSAAEQSGRATLPTVASPISFAEAIKQGSFDLKVIPWETEGRNSLKKILKEYPQIKNIAVYIGPEGGFSHAEIELAKNQNIFPVTLGPRILRTETAGIYILSSLSYELEL
ncbi:MAG: 16S rRNA (uracil(1498)-N(3))-methyltransferase [Candidatus Margulisbacteria bacterium]|nr:16S rRNA (uracil(1498)-N(3))-methyltransferase [Candidatus Margulisiibacteriota bacterium]MBU1021439.1 16S rRNA (uracil(1498)-N(3))-methyltransferase [Candidatus Margulisiibacteriota bacterium]MBU1728360.1 16S rRNA (uracil(1498)-N(3))-methyltransferase [Candidatus Margulisiibacteriota bacterium]MBU1955897.1 16S rRNA (uracil(1498)-N(3))-methyltransferase [Candidatus Margulisiibacteriota bacterium]